MGVLSHLLSLVVEEVDRGLVLLSHDLVQGEDGTHAARLLQVVTQAVEDAICKKILHAVISDIVKVIVHVEGVEGVLIHAVIKGE